MGSRRVGHDWAHTHPYMHTHALVHGLDRWFTFDRQKTTKVIMGWHVWDRVIRDCDSVPYLYSFSLWLSSVCSLRYYELPCYKLPTCQGTEGSLQPTVSKELKPTASEELSAANHRMHATGSNPPLAKPDVDSSPSQHFASCNTLKQRTQLSHILAPDL